MTNTQFEALMRELRALRAALSPLGFAPAPPEPRREAHTSPNMIPAGLDIAKAVADETHTQRRGKARR